MKEKSKKKDPMNKLPVILARTGFFMISLLILCMIIFIKINMSLQNSLFKKIPKKSNLNSSFRQINLVKESENFEREEGDMMIKSIFK